MNQRKSYQNWAEVLSSSRATPTQTGNRACPGDTMTIKSLGQIPIRGCSEALLWARDHIHHKLQPLIKPAFSSARFNIQPQQGLCI